ncbi:MAG TPA: VanZ family protein [Candidatus Mediterraneibacter norwichensis]|nr:VanZ family protein [Candidatus Mediterraneibacter norwichensis]
MLLWMALIFFYSSRQADVSAEDSGRIGITLGRIFISDFEEWPEEEQQEFAARIDHPVRKTAHAAEYAVLGFLAAGACAGTAGSAGTSRSSGMAGSSGVAESAGTAESSGVAESAGTAESSGVAGRTGNGAWRKFRKEMFLPWLIAALYAASDEIHQLFVPGRSGQLSDVILDSAGALAGVAAFTVLCWLINRRKARVS